ncbi:MAG: DUF2304 domain-containing protein [Propionibacteriaceae bacterium]|jgi:hypothetical protein|nr:DUF2304 domain-containing protein [Propionibacteriaceae bacterium]
MRAMILFLVLAVIIVVAVVLLLRSRKIAEKYAVLWLVVGLVAIVLAAFPSLLTSLANLVGVYVPTNLLFALSILLLLGVCMHLSLSVSRLDDRVRRLAEEAAILRQQVDDSPLGSMRQSDAGQAPDQQAANGSDGGLDQPVKRSRQ